MTSQDKLTRAEAKRICRYLESKNHYDIRIVEFWEDKSLEVASFNQCGMARHYYSQEAAVKDNRQ